MSEKRVAREIQMLVSIAAKLSRTSLDERLLTHKAGISSLQYGILRMIHAQPLTITTLSQMMRLDPSTLVPAVDALERHELARRTKDPKDRRRTPLSITDQGLALLDRIPALDEAEALFNGLAQMSEVNQEHLLALLRELVGHLLGSEDAVRGITANAQGDFKEP